MPNDPITWNALVVSVLSGGIAGGAVSATVTGWHERNERRKNRRIEAADNLLQASTRLRLQIITLSQAADRVRERIAEVIATAEKAGEAMPREQGEANRLDDTLEAFADVEQEQRVEDDARPSVRALVGELQKASGVVSGLYDDLLDRETRLAIVFPKRTGVYAAAESLRLACGQAIRVVHRRALDDSIEHNERHAFAEIKLAEASFLNKAERACR